MFELKRNAFDNQVIDMFDNHDVVLELHKDASIADGIAVLDNQFVVNAKLDKNAIAFEVHGKLVFDNQSATLDANTMSRGWIPFDNQSATFEANDIS